MKNTLLVPELRELIETGQIDALRAFCEDVHPATAAEMIGALSPSESWSALRHLDPLVRSDIFSHLEDETQTEMLSILSRKDAADILADMPPDDRADLFKLLPEERREDILPALAQAEREDIRRLASYEEGTAGSVMTSDYVMLPLELTAQQAIDRLREVAPDRETIYTAYIVDAKRRVQGFVSLKDLIVARRDARVGDIMHTDVICARVQDDQEDAARKIQKYDLLALPVVDAGDALVGIITHDDALDIITQEQTEDIEKLMAIAGAHEAGAYVKTSAWAHFKSRAVWLVILAFFGLISGFIVQSFEGLLQQFAILAVFMPMLADTGGNTGSQSATLVVRALALKEIGSSDIMRILWKELRVSLLLGLLLAVVAFGRVMAFGGGSSVPEGVALGTIGFAIALALGLQVVTSTLIGALLPLGAARLKLDPALVASPALTTVVDITGLLIFFSTAKFFVGL